jgi:DNA-binding CsgD family transcriptional regulator
MPTEPTQSELVEARNSRLAHHRNLTNPEMDAHNLIKVEQLRQMAIKESNSYFFIELCQKKFTHIFSAYHPYLIHPTIKVSNAENMSDTNIRAQADTVCFNLESDILFYDLLMAQPFEQRRNFVSVMLRCLKDEKGKFQVWLFTTSVNECDVVGTPCSLIAKGERMDLFSAEKFHPYRQFYLANETNPDKPILLESDNKHVLTGKELKVLEMSIAKRTIKEIAKELGVESCTIKSHRKQVMLKLNAPTFSLACMMAKRLKIV